MSLRLVVMLSLGCAQPEVVVLQGVTMSGLRTEFGPLGDVSVRALDGNLDDVGSVRSDAGGAFRLEVPQGARIFLVVGERPDQVPATFAGVSGFNPRLRVDNGLLSSVPTQALNEERSRWDGCPGLDEGGLAVGEVLVDGLFQEETGDPVVVTTGIVEVALDDGRILPGCYLGPDGLYQAGLSQTGEPGQFLVAGIPEGLHELRLRWRPVGTNELTETYVLYMPEGGVAPRFPLYVRFDP